MTPNQADAAMGVTDLLGNHEQKPKDTHNRGTGCFQRSDRPSLLQWDPLRKPI